MNIHCDGVSENSLEQFSALSDFDDGDTKIVASVIGDDCCIKLAYELFAYQGNHLKTDAQIIQPLRKINDPELKCIEMFNKWKMQSPKPTNGELLKALEKADLQTIATSLKNKWISHHLSGIIMETEN